MYSRRWECINNCTTFETVGHPEMCPHCGSTDLYPASSGFDMIEQKERDVEFTND
jgi:RNA polymerase subunit RPABC4/transcription elongation factor Spt4